MLERNGAMVKEEEKKGLFLQQKNQQLSSTLEEYENRFQMFTVEI